MLSGGFPLPFFCTVQPHLDDHVFFVQLASIEKRTLANQNSTGAKIVALFRVPLLVNCLVRWFFHRPVVFSPCNHHPTIKTCFHFLGSPRIYIFYVILRFYPHVLAVFYTKSIKAGLCLAETICPILGTCEFFVLPSTFMLKCDS